ncbi:hypothetical protein AKJ37_03625 [candidate division MSBL1 archaeon SCGC-AAA259I09]|uniref:Uncharacterized protein n=2 Tax=candidate division MSBL1 TaxID=215777 RepID=A0A133USI0_9EURY|nr:hypothetical protein AKJ66_02310 [candidate division MSBL1 archaeon SCGC-AAA259E22]KXA97153.1 hypothetical protein AKJ37_03625 [candidate division MSBL1 archaeon SCGC-AAA259I09]
MNNLTKGFISTILVFVIVVGVPAVVAGINDQLIGVEDPTVQADNLLTGEYHWDNGSATQISTVSYTVGTDNNVFSITVPSENADDSGEDYVVLKFNKPEASTIVNQGLIRLYHEIVTVDNYENIQLTVEMAGGTGTVQLYDNNTLNGNKFTNLEEISTDFAYYIKNNAGDNAVPKVTLKTPAGDNQVLAGEILDPVVSWGYETRTQVHATHEAVWQMSMILMGTFCFILAIFATAKFDFEVN